jgi:hypothetical protein
MGCYAGSASSGNATECQPCAVGDVCPAGTSLDELGDEVIETSGTLRLVGITAENFESAKKDIIQVIKQNFYTKHGVWLTDDDIQLSGSNGRRVLSTGTGFELQFTIKMPAGLESNGAATNTTIDSNTSNTSSTPVFAFDAAAVTRLVVASIKSDEVASAMNVSTGFLDIVSIVEPSQGKSTKGACPAGKYVAAGMGECTACAPGRAAPKGSSNCLNCEPGTFAAEPGSPACKLCPASKFQEDPQQTVCLICRAHALTVRSGASSVQEVRPSVNFVFICATFQLNMRIMQCVCEQSYFDCTSDLGVCKLNECNECPFDAKCDQAETLDSLQARGDLWRATNRTIVFHQCPQLGACKGGRVLNGSRDSQCASGYAGVRCELCDYENGYAVHQPGSKCSLCKPNEGRDSMYLAAGAFCGLLLLVVIAKIGLCPRWLSRVKQITVTNGQHQGRVGELTGPHSEVDQLNDALRRAQHAPIGPHSAFELFSAAQAAALSGRPQRRTSIINNALRRRWDSAISSVRGEFEQRAREEEDRYQTKKDEYWQQQSVLHKRYTAKLQKDDQHDSDIDVILRGCDLRLRTLDLQKAYEGINSVTSDSLP